MVVRVVTPLVDRFWMKVICGIEPDACWVWIGARSKGYGQIGIGPRPMKLVYAHHVSYGLHIGAVPDGMVIDHLCNNRACVRPSHLTVTTNRLNVLRGSGASARNARRTHCAQGHPLTPVVGVRKHGQLRTCRICNAERCRQWRAQRFAMGGARAWSCA